MNVRKGGKEVHLLGRRLWRVQDSRRIENWFGEFQIFRFANAALLEKCRRWSRPGKLNNLRQLTFCRAQRRRFELQGNRVERIQATLKIELQAAIRIATPASPRTMLLHARNHFIAPRLAVRTRETLTWFSRHFRPLRRILRRIADLRTDKYCRALKFVRTRRGVAANRTGHSSSCELRQKSENNPSTGWQSFALEKLAC